MKRQLGMVFLFVVVTVVLVATLRGQSLVKAQGSKGVTTLVSRGHDGAPASDDPFDVVLSGDGANAVYADIATAGANVELIAHVTARASSIAVDDRYVYVLSSEDANLRIFDIAEPSNPTEIGSLAGFDYPQDIAVVGDLAYVADHQSGGLRIISIADRSEPSEIGRYDTPGAARGVAVDGRYAYVADSGYGTIVVDIRDPARPQLIGVHSTPTHDRAVAVSGNYAYIASDSAGLRILDISDPTDPREVGGWDEDPLIVVNVEVQGAYAYVMTSRLHILEISNPALPLLMGTYSYTPGTATAVALANGYAYLTNGTDGLRVVSVANPACPVEDGHFDTPGTSTAVASHGDYTYVVDQNSDLYVLRHIRSSTTTYSISGHALDSYGSPIPGIRISTSTGYNCSVTDRTGTYTIRGLPAAQYSVGIEPTYPYAWTNRWQMVTVPPDATNVNFAGESRSALGGRIIDSVTGRPVQGVQALLSNGQTSDSGSTGYYRFSDLAPGNYTLTFSARDYSLVPGSYAVSVPPERLNLDVSASSVFIHTISGIVRDSETGQPAGGVELTAAGEYEWYRAYSGLDGSFTLGQLRPGVYTVVPFQVGFRFLPVEETISVPPDANAIEFIRTENPADIQSNSNSTYPAISDDGRLVAFLSSATNLVEDDTNGHVDVFLRDTQTWTTTRVSVATDGAQANNLSEAVDISADGQYVVYQSLASNLALDDANGVYDVFLYDVQTGETSLLSRGTDGGSANGDSAFPSVSADGRFVAFSSRASNLTVADTNNREDVFLLDRSTGTISLVSLTVTGAPSAVDCSYPDVSDNGARVTFFCDPHVYVRDIVAGRTSLVSVSTTGEVGNAQSFGARISGDGVFVAFSSQATNLVSGDTNRNSDVFVRDLATSRTQRVSISSSGTQGVSGGVGAAGPSISGDGSLVAFTTSFPFGAIDTTDSQNIYVRDRSAGTTSLVDETLAGTAFGYSEHPAISAGGRFVAFVSSSPDLVVGDTNRVADVFVYDLQTKVLARVSVQTGAAVHAIAGTVRDANGVSLAGVTVSNGTASTITDTDGHYSLTGLTAAQHVLTASRAGFNFTPASLPVTVPPDAINKDFASTTPVFSVSGMIVDRATGIPLGGVPVTLSGSKPVQTNSDGVYTFSQVPPGDYTIAPVKAGFVFVPAWRRIAVSSNTADQSFVGRDNVDTLRLSVSSAGVQGNGGSLYPVLSADGNRVAFVSLADNLVTDDTNGGYDVFVHDKSTGETVRASVRSGEGQAPADAEEWDYIDLAADGNRVAFGTYSPVSDMDGNGWSDVYVHDLTTHATVLASASPTGEAGNGDSRRPKLSANGRYVAFDSTASNLVTGDGGNDADVFLRDITQGAIYRVSLAPGGAEPNGHSYLVTISPDGRFVYFHSDATDLIGGQTTPAGGLYVYDHALRTITHVLLPSTIRAADLSDDGRYLVFSSPAPNIVPEDTGATEDVFVFDTIEHTTRRVSVSSENVPGDGRSYAPRISGNGRFVGFISLANNLVPTDLNGTADVFVHDLLFGETIRVSISWAGEGAVGDLEEYVSLSSDGAYVAFNSFAANLVANDTNNNWDVFLRILDDPDYDGVETFVEDGAANNGDGNGDGVLDSQQADVASLNDSASGAYTSLAVGNGAALDYGETDTYTALAVDNRVALKGVNAVSNPAPSSTPSKVQFPIGFVNLGIVNVPVGGMATIEVLPSDSIAAQSYYSYGPTPDNPADHWYEFVYDGITGAEIRADRITLHFVDGGRGDSDLIADGDIQHQGGPAVLLPPAIYLSPTSTATISGRAFTSADILSYAKSTNTWDILYDGSYVRTTKNVGAFAFQGNDILLGFSAAQAITGLGTAAPQDLVRFTPTLLGYNNTAGTFAWFFDGSDVGLTTSGEIIDALWIDAAGLLYISTTGTGEVLTNPAVSTSPKIKFQDEDVLRFTPTSTGATTAGTWELYWDPTLITGMSAEDINGYWEDPATGHRYVTILGAFTVGNTAYGGRFTGNGKTILRFAPNVAAPAGWAPAEKVTWLAAGATFPSNIDAIEMAR